MPLSTLDNPLLIALLLLIGVVIPVLGNLCPEKVSFLPSMRYYAGNWATSQWLFRKDTGAEAKLDTRRSRAGAGSWSSSWRKLYGRETAELLHGQGARLPLDALATAAR